MKMSKQINGRGPRTQFKPQLIGGRITSETCTAGRKPIVLQVLHSCGYLITTLLMAVAPANSEELRSGGVVMSRSQTTLSSQISAQILNMPFRYGEEFEAGDILVRFDCEILDAEADAVAAKRAASELRLSTNLELLQVGAVSQEEVLLSRSELENAVANLAVAEAKLKGCEIRAPFGGRVVEQLSREYSSVPAHEPVISITDTRALEIEILAPSSWLRWLVEGAPLSFEVIDIGKIYQAHVLKLGANIDPVSHTIIIKAAFDQVPEAVLPGMSGVAIFRGPDGS